MFSRVALISALAISTYSYSLTNLHIIINLISFSPNYFSENKKSSAALAYSATN